MNRKKVCIVTLCILFLAFPVTAGKACAGENNLELTVDECIERALTENLNLRSARLGLRLNDLSLVQEKSVFDPSLSLNVNRGQSESPNYTSYIPVSTVQSKSTRLNFTLGQTLITGTQWGMGFYNTLSESNIEVEKNYSSYLGFSINQPLLKGFGRKVNRSGIYTAKLQKESTRYDIENNAVKLLSQVLNSYWGLVNARESLYALELSRAQADSLLQYNRKALELGILTESDVLEARSALLAREQEILDQKNQIRMIEDELKRLLNITTTENGSLRIIPADKLDIPAVDLNAEKAIEDAHIYRPDYLIALTAMKQNEIQLNVSKNSALPDLNLSVSYRINSSGTTVSKDIRDLQEANAYGWDVGLRLNYPLKNRNAKAALEKRHIDIKRAQLSLDELENQILTDIRTSIRKVEINREKVDVAALSVEVNEMKLKKEEELFRNQLSTSYFVLQYQKDLANSRNLYQKALMDYTLSVLEYQRSRGTLLADLHVNILTTGN